MAETNPAEDSLALLALADRRIVEAEERLARQAMLIGRLAAEGRDTRQADDLLWTMGLDLDTMRKHRRSIAGEGARGVQALSIRP